MDRSRLQDLASKGRIAWTRHALQRMHERQIKTYDVVQILTAGEQIEDYPVSRPLPGALYFKIVSGRPLHVVVAIDGEHDYTQVITVYEPELDEFESDYKTRRKK